MKQNKLSGRRSHINKTSNQESDSFRSKLNYQKGGKGKNENTE